MRLQTKVLHLIIYSVLPGLSDSNGIRTQNHLFRKRTLNYIPKLVKWLGLFVQQNFLLQQYAKIHATETFPFPELMRDNNPFHAADLYFIPPENIQKPLVF